jgi:gamma-glutamylcyclotransferase (GGCT)/AIG2-like uncharacterized protein YtfP
MRYFGYGSNLDGEDLATWAAARGHDVAGMRPLGPAFLPDHELTFRYRSQARGGGALSVRARLGAAVPGALFAVDEAAIAALDEKEGVPRFYRRRQVVVLDLLGDEIGAFTYVVQPGRIEGRHVAPTVAYLAAVRRGLDAHGQATAPLAEAARHLSPPTWPRRMFVYGTLLPEGPSAPATIPGRLVDLGAYPGWVLGPGRVQGALVRPREDLRELDRYEDFLGYGVPGSLYRRVVVTATRADGAREEAWAYRYLGTDGRPLPSGSWRRR